MNVTYTIGELAKAANVGVETIRYYHRCGLLPMPEREYGSYRRYPPQSLERLQFIRRAQALGFTLDEVRALLQFNDGLSCQMARTLAEHKLQVVEERLRDLRILRTELRKVIAQCQANRKEASCPLIEELCGPP